MAPAVSEPDLYRPLTLHLPKLIFYLRCLGRTKASAQVRAWCTCFVTRPVFRWSVVSTSPKPQAEEPPLVSCTGLLIQCIRNYLLYWKSFFQPEPEDAPCRDDGDTLIMGDFYRIIFKMKLFLHSLSASPLSNEEFCVLITLGNSQILAYCISRFGGSEI